MCKFSSIVGDAALLEFVLIGLSSFSTPGRWRCAACSRSVNAVPAGLICFIVFAKSSALISAGTRRCQMLLAEMCGARARERAKAPEGGARRLCSWRKVMV